MGVRSRGGSLRTPAGALARTAAGTADPHTEAPRSTAAEDRLAADPSRRDVGSTNSGAAGTAVEAPSATEAESSNPAPEDADADAGPPPSNPLLRGPANIADLITVALVEKAAADLERTHKRSQLSKTDIVNRAISLYEFIDAELSNEAELIVRRDGHDNLLELL